MNTLVIGDIHGCYYELQALLDKAGLGEGDRILAVGDVVDRGPETPQVLAFFRDTPGAQSVMGNHERKHLRGSRGEVPLSLSQQISRAQFGDDYRAALAWMAGLPLYYELPEAVVLHGYLEPGIPIHEQAPTVLCGTMGGDQILARHYSRPWYELYEGEEPAVVGHKNYTNSDQPFVYRDKVFGLETSCVLGKALTGLLLPAFRFVSVPSRGNLWKGIRGAHRQAEKPRPPKKPAIEWNEAGNTALAELLEAVEQAKDALLLRLQARLGYNELTARQQARLYADEVGSGPLAVLLHLARQGHLTPDEARRVLRTPDHLEELKQHLLLGRLG